MKRLRLVSAIMAVFAVTCGMNTVQAGWGSYGSYGSYGGGSYGSSGSSGYAAYSYGSSGASYGSSGYGSSGYGSSGHRPGLLARIANKVHNHFHHSHGSSGHSYGSSGSSGYTYSYGSSGYGSSGSTVYYSSSSYGSYGSSGYSSYSYGSSGYSTYSSSYGSSGYTTSYSAPVTYSVAPSYSYSSDGCSTCGGGQTIYSTPIYDSATPAQTGTPTPAEGVSLPQSSEVMLTVNVPEGATVFVNGKATRSTGAVRQYVSRGLQSGKLYDYEVRIEANVEGKLVSNVKRVSMRAGESREVAFENGKAGETPVTALKVRVPDDAEVTLAGNKTSATGAERVFRTSDLPVGQVWDNYTVVVSIVRDGQTITKEKTLTLVSGNEYELAFDFEQPKVAMR